MNVTYLPKELIVKSDLDQLEIYANNLVEYMQSNEEINPQWRYRLREALMEVVMFLYRYNVNLTHLLTK